MNILKPKTGHGGDTFRELIDMWQENGYCEVKHTDSQFCWVGERGDILLYDFPRLDDRDIEPFRVGLFGNTVPDHERCSPWTFWARKPRLLEEHRKDIPKERDIETMFLGKVENHIQLNNRNVDWSEVIELFSMPIRLGDATNNNYPYTPDQYMSLVKRSKYGLCLPGYGPKCNREIEYMGLGTVPIVTPNVDMTYYDSPIEGEHYIRVESPDKLEEIISSISKEKWRQMSRNCLEWYERNASPKGSFDITMRIIENEFNYISV